MCPPFGKAAAPCALSIVLKVEQAGLALIQNNCTNFCDYNGLGCLPVANGTTGAREVDAAFAAFGRDRPDALFVSGAPFCSAGMFLGRCVDKRVRCFVGSSIVWREHNECNACHVGDLTALVWKENSVDVSFSLGEHLLSLGADTLFPAPRKADEL